MVAYINLGCYYIFGLPLGFVLGYWVKWGVEVSSSFIKNVYIYESKAEEFNGREFGLVCYVEQHCRHSYCFILFGELIGKMR